ncbi:MAG: hypothetical protein JW854_03175 [Actinobacteria bacterium]|nr:hypothetical protein [Actinomycetota bacterium]
MPGIEVCPECGVPSIIGSGQRWENNGVISLAMSPDNRLVFYETGVIDGLFRGIEELIGKDIWHIVTESRRRDVRKFIELSFPDEIEAMQQFDFTSDVKELVEMRRENTLQVNTMALIYGYGEIKLSNLWELGEDYPWRNQVIVNPWSMYLYPAELLGSVEAFEQTDMKVEYTQIAENLYELTTFPAKHPLELKGRLKKKRYPFKPGEICYERCPLCEVPVDVGNCRWNLENGVIYDPMTKRRMAMFGPWAVDSVLDDLIEELGERVQEIVIEALRRHLRTTMSEEMWKRDMVTFNRMSAMRGLGNLVQFEGDRDYLTVTFENACMPLLMVGTVQGLFEMAMGKEASTYEWEMADDGDLTVTVRGEKAMAVVESPAVKGIS